MYLYNEADHQKLCKLCKDSEMPDPDPKGWITGISNIAAYTGYHPESIRYQINRDQIYTVIPEFNRHVSNKKWLATQTQAIKKGIITHEIN